MKANGIYEANNAGIVMGWYWKLIKDRMLPFPKIGKNNLIPYLQKTREAAMSIQSYVIYGKDHLAYLDYKMTTEYIKNTNY